MSIKIIIILTIIASLISPLSSNAQCTYGDLIDGNPNHPNGIWCWPPNATICYCYNSWNEPFSDAKTEVDDAACKWSNADGYTISEDATCGNGDIIWINNVQQWHDAKLDDNAAAGTEPHHTEDGMYSVSYTHLTLPTNREV